nr:MAG TPA: hypothetical protein [Bacteriophage sp.]
MALVVVDLLMILILYLVLMAQIRSIQVLDILVLYI